MASRGARTAGLCGQERNGHFPVTVWYGLPHVHGIHRRMCAVTGPAGSALLGLVDVQVVQVRRTVSKAGDRVSFFSQSQLRVVAAETQSVLFDIETRIERFGILT